MTGITGAGQTGDAWPQWERLEEALTAYREFQDGIRPWHERYDEADLPPGPCKQSAAIELAERDAVEARLELLAGAR